MALNTIIYEKFRSSFEQKCFDLIIDAYHTSLTEKIIQLDWNENDISEELYEKLDDNPKRVEYNIIANREDHLPKNVEKKKGFADRLPRVDLRMSSIVSKLEFKYFFEAKRLKENDSKLKRSYIDDGMERFTSNKYPIGCMLGYLLQGNINEAVKGINSLLVKDKRKTETLTSKPNELYKNYFESEHTEIGKLKHLIFDFTMLSI